MIPPIIIISYNNYKYVKNTINQIEKINKEYLNYVHILDNCSNCDDTINYLKTLSYKVIYNTKNNGPWINEKNNIELYNQLPDKYIVTDPDLEFNSKLPTNFIEILMELGKIYNCSKIGFALDISDFSQMYQNTYYEYEKKYNIYDWEIRFWKEKINNTNFNLYDAPVDTTFSLINKKISIYGRNIRVAGHFTAKHLPWYTNNKIYSVYENYIANIKTTSISSGSKMILSHIDNKFLKLNKNNEIFLIENKENDDNLFFWKITYEIWEKGTFDIFDTYLDKNKIFIDIGGWIGATSMYGSRKSKYVYSIETDTKSFEEMALNLQINCNNNYTLINKAIHNIDNIEIKFGKNKNLNASKMNGSTSKIYNDNDNDNDNKSSSEYYSIQTITLKNLLEVNNINPMEISLINVDIEGGEENILDDLYYIHQTYNTRLYVSFHYSWWKDKNLDRFTFLTEQQKHNIINQPFISLLF